MVLLTLNRKIYHLELDNASEDREIECITQYGSTVYIGIAMVFVFPPYIREIQFLLSVSSQFNFW